MKTKLLLFLLLSAFCVHLQGQIKYEAFSAKQREFQIQQKTLKDQLKTAENLTPQVKDSLQKQLKAMAEANYKLVRQAIDDNRNDRRFLNVLNNYIRPKITSEQYEAELKAFSPEVQATKEWKYEMEYLKNQRLMVAGNPCVDFEATGHDGKKYRLSEIYQKNKLTLIDFWASWCGPCRASMPHLIELYGKYKSEGLEIVSVSIDGSKEMWDAAYTKLQLPWIDCSNLGGNTDPLMLTYAFRSIPHKVLVDSKGIIIGVGFNKPKSLEKELEKYLK